MIKANIAENRMATYILTKQGERSTASFVGSRLVVSLNSRFVLSPRFCGIEFIPLQSDIELVGSAIYSAGKEAQLLLLRSAMSGNAAYNANGTIRQFIYHYANSSPETEKANYVMRVCPDLGIPSTPILKTLL